MADDTGTTPPTDPTLALPTGPSFFNPAYLTPNQRASWYAYANQLMQPQPVKRVSQGIAEVVRSLMGGMVSHQADMMEQAGTKASWQKSEAVAPIFTGVPNAPAGGGAPAATGPSAASAPGAAGPGYAEPVAADADAEHLTQRFADRAQDLQQDAADAGIPTTMVSGFRDNALQAKLYANYQARQSGHALPYPQVGQGGMAAPPGQSMHNSGNAADIVANGPGAQTALNHLASEPWRGITPGVIFGDPDHYQLADGSPNAPAPAAVARAAPAGPLAYSPGASGSPPAVGALGGVVSPQNAAMAAALMQRGAGGAPASPYGGLADAAPMGGNVPMPPPRPPGLGTPPASPYGNLAAALQFPNGAPTPPPRPPGAASYGDMASTAQFGGVPMPPARPTDLGASTGSPYGDLGAAAGAFAPRAAVASPPVPPSASAYAPPAPSAAAPMAPPPRPPMQVAQAAPSLGVSNHDIAAWLSDPNIPPEVLQKRLEMIQPHMMTDATGNTYASRLFQPPAQDHPFFAAGTPQNINGIPGVTTGPPTAPVTHLALPTVPGQTPGGAMPNIMGPGSPLGDLGLQKAQTDAAIEAQKAKSVAAQTRFQQTQTAGPALMSQAYPLRQVQAILDKNGGNIPTGEGSERIQGAASLINMVATVLNHPLTGEDSRLTSMELLHKYGTQIAASQAQALGLPNTNMGQETAAGVAPGTGLSQPADTHLVDNLIRLNALAQKKNQFEHDYYLKNGGAPNSYDNFTQDWQEEISGNKAIPLSKFGRDVTLKDGSKGVWVPSTDSSGFSLFRKDDPAFDVSKMAPGS